MSRVEKEFNRFDLRTYKKNQNDINCMIPGIRNIPSVGSQPTRGGDPLIKMHQQMLNSASFTDTNTASPMMKKNNTTATLVTPANGNSPSIVSDGKSKEWIECRAGYWEGNESHVFVQSDYKSTTWISVESVFVETTESDQCWCGRQFHESEIVESAATCGLLSAW